MDTSKVKYLQIEAGLYWQASYGNPYWAARLIAMDEDFNVLSKTLFPRAWGPEEMVYQYLRAFLAEEGLIPEDIRYNSDALKALSEKGISVLMTLKKDCSLKDLKALAEEASK